MRAIGVRLLMSMLLTSALPVVPGVGQPAAPDVHGTPAGWRLRWPEGDPRKGREAFVRFECYSCHEVQGERFRAPASKEALGPELAAMGPLHDAEYFIEAIVSPSATIEPGRGYAAGDGSSKMPSYNDTLTVQELVDLVAYLRALRPPAAPPAPGGAGHGAHH
jgi:mono/diheme cytochrome c family protein